MDDQISLSACIVNKMPLTLRIKTNQSMNIKDIITKVRISSRDRLVLFCNDDLVRISRIRHTYKEFKRCKPEMLLAPLEPEQRQEILDYWKQFRNVEKELQWWDFYNGLCPDKSQLKYYIPDVIFYSDVDRYFTHAIRSEHFDDKNMYDTYFHDVKTPQTVIRKIDGEYFDDNYLPITFDQAVKLCVDTGQVVTKEARLSSGGKGVRFFDFSQDSVEELKRCLQSNNDINVQHVLQQHECLNKIHDKSINTLRLMTLYLDGKVNIISSVLRMGRDGGRVDNGSHGGIICGINDDGTLKEFAYNTRGYSWKQHPQGVTFKGYKITGYEACREMAMKLAGRLITASRLVSWDFAIDVTGEPVLIEVNLTYGGVLVHQLCNGPIFGDMTQDILSRVYHKS